MSSTKSAVHVARPHQEVVSSFIRRLNAAVTRSPLLKVPSKPSSRHIDVVRLACLGTGAPRSVVDAITQGTSHTLKFQIQDSMFDNDAEGPLYAREKAQHVLLSHLESMRRAADLARRETGIHALWLAFPLIFVPGPPEADASGLLAPVFLFPLDIVPDPRHQGRVDIRPKAGMPPRFNTAMAAWVQRNHAVELNAPTSDQLEDLDGASLPSLLDHVFGGLSSPPAWTARSTLREVPNLKDLTTSRVFQLYPTAIMGLFRWQNESILADLEKIRSTTDCATTASQLLTGSSAEEFTITPPGESDRYFVTDADFSQQRVVWKSRVGTGLVVHGPPGTGKSQTIVNIIADALAHNQTVLMVCQKEAATRVVKQRLDAAGLSGLCLEMHDPESDRQSLFKSIRDQVDQLPTALPRSHEADREHRARQIESVERDLDEFAAAMHTPHPRCRCSYRQLLAWEGLSLHDFPTARPLSALVPMGAMLDSGSISALLHIIERAGTAFGEAKYFTNPWRHRLQTVVPSPTLERDVRSLVELASRLDTENAACTVADPIEFVFPRDPGLLRQSATPTLRKLETIERLSRNDRALVGQWMASDGFNSGRTEPAVDIRVRDAASLAQTVQQASPDPAWAAATAGTSALDLEVMRTSCRLVGSYQNSWWRFAVRSFRVASAMIRKHRPDAIGPAIFNVARMGELYFSARDREQRLADSARTLLPDAGFDPTSSREAIEQVRRLASTFHHARELASVKSSTPCWTPLIDAVLGSPEDRPTLARRAMQRVDDRFRVVEPLLRHLEQLRLWLSPPTVDALQDEVRAGRSISQFLDSLADGLSGLDALRSLEALQRTNDLPVRQSIDALIQYERSAFDGHDNPVHPRPDTPTACGAWWRALAAVSLYDAWRSEIFADQPILLRLSGRDQQQLINELREALRAKRGTEVPVILRRWLAAQLEIRHKPWSVFFKLRGSKNGPAPKLREAVRASLDQGLLALRPVWLTNPAAAAQVFPLADGLFDVVIFDEASQCPIEQALPIVWRGKRVVVSGDEKQLPPTSFFAASSTAESEDEDDVDAEASDQPVELATQRVITAHVQESADLLAAAIGSLPQDYLMVHYRSEHPALIEFSNRAFYGGRLEAPPARHPPGTAIAPIEYIRVNGPYERRRRVNQSEAIEVVRAVRRVLETDPRCPTVGVVTFNQPQRELIQDLLEVERQKDRAFSSRYEAELNRIIENQDVGLFVKNLENVQGDERDVMIFSTTFGPDDAGAFRRQFGPVGQEGGHRRLNVAVTRAKRRIVLVSSMPINEVAAALSASEPGSGITPAGYLQLYLAYAEGVSVGHQPGIQRVLDRLLRPAVDGSQGDPESILEEQVLDAICDMGFSADCQIGAGGFRIDLAVRHPDSSRGYVLGIECDGATYHSDRSARLRDVWRQEILERRYGWNIHRIWSTRWWMYGHEERAKLRDAIERAVAAT